MLAHSSQSGRWVFGAAAQSQCIDQFYMFNQTRLLFSKIGSKYTLIIRSSSGSLSTLFSVMRLALPRRVILTVVVLFNRVWLRFLISNWFVGTRVVRRVCCSGASRNRQRLPAIGRSRRWACLHHTWCSRSWFAAIAVLLVVVIARTAMAGRPLWNFDLYRFSQLQSHDDNFSTQMVNLGYSSTKTEIIIIVFAHLALWAKLSGEIYSACIKPANQLTLMEAYSETLEIGHWRPV